jgi:hypothetical protein
MQKYLLGLVASSSVAVGCVTHEAAPTQPLPTTTGSYVGHYQVPTTPDLASAAHYPVTHVDWTVAAGIATLHYDLPLGLVGGPISVTLTGTIDPGATMISVAGAVGVGSCVANATTITCREAFSNLGVLPISVAVVEQFAALEYAGPASDRIAVANVFSSDPIGIVDFDLQAPIIDDHGGSGH